jgi:hypothetical protein
MTTARILALLAVAGGLAAWPLLRGRTPAEPALRETRPGLVASAAVTPDSARRLALRRYPGASVASALLRERGRRLTYVLELRGARANGRTEVLVDAETGRVVGLPLTAPGDSASAAAPD